MLKVALLGAGYMGKTHLDRYLKNDRCRVTYVFDKDIARADRMTADLNIKATGNIDEILGNEVDMVDICLPTFLHKGYAVLAAQAGKHILCEKPMASDLEECDSVMEAAQANNIKYMTAHVVRFMPEYEYIKSIMESGELGSPIYAAAGRVQPTPSWSEANWVIDPLLSLGGVVDLQIHDLDFMSWVFGRPVSMKSVGSRSKHGGWEQVITVMEYANGFNSSIEACNMMPKGYPFTAKFKVLFTKGSVEYDSGSLKKFVVHRPSQERFYPEFTDPDGYQKEIDYFVDCVISGKKTSIVTVDDARFALYLALRSKESLDERKTVSI